MRTLFARILIASLIALIAAPAFAGDDKNKKNDPTQIGDRDVGKCLNFYSVEKEMALGKQLAEEVAREAKVVDDPILSEYINRIGQNLARNSDAKVPFTFRLLQNDVPNAFALPGGFIFVHTGLIGIAAEEDEFAGALAHEIAHVAARHLTCRETKAQLANIGTIPLSILLGGWAGVAARQAAGAVIPMTFLSFSRHDESEADFLGVQYMWAAGYDPTGAISMFEKLETLQRTQPTAVSKLLSTHPMDSDRIAKTQAEIDKILPSKPEYIVTTSDYTNMRQRLLTMENRRKPDDPNKPQLRRAPGVDDTTGDDGRPTLKRRDLTQ
ncbi:MAG: M48 family metallopeptidase [Bryobacteraceae bacterium]